MKWVITDLAANGKVTASELSDNERQFTGNLQTGFLQVRGGQVLFVLSNKYMSIEPGDLALEEQPTVEAPIEAPPEPRPAKVKA